MAVKLPDARQLSDDVLKAFRLRALHGCEQGFTQAEVAKLLGVSHGTVSRWWHGYRSKGLDGIPTNRTGRPIGTGRTLSEEQADYIQHLIDTKSPSKLKIASPVWSRRAIRDLIIKQFGISIPIRTVGEYLKRWGYTAKKPRRHASDQDPKEVKRWLAINYPELVCKAKSEGAVILWCDEVGIAADSFARYAYARKGHRATIEVPKPHIRVNLISAISNTGLLRFMTYTEGMDAALFLVFLTRLIDAINAKIYLIADNLPAHQARKVQRWVAKHKNQIEIVPLPKYSPELNADEYLNNDVKDNVKALGLPDNQDRLRALIQSFMHRLRYCPGHVISYFLNPWVRYAAPA